MAYEEAETWPWPCRKRGSNRGIRVAQQRVQAVEWRWPDAVVKWHASGSSIHGWSWWANQCGGCGDESYILFSLMGHQGDIEASVRGHLD